MPEKACEEGFRHVKHGKFNSIESKIQLSVIFLLKKPRYEAKNRP